MRRADDVLTEIVDDETVVYDLKTKQVHCLGPLAAAVFDACDGRSPRASIAVRAQERVGSAVTEEDVSNALAQLQERELLETPLVLRPGISRRDLIQKTAYVGAAAAGAALITSVGAPTAQAAQSPGRPPGAPCTQNNQCASNHCCRDQAGGAQCNAGLCVACDNSCHYIRDTTTCPGFCDPNAPTSGPGSECRCLV